MIFVTIGTHNRGFERLVRAADELAARIDERVLIQRGSAEYLPAHAEHFRFTDGQRIEELAREARVIISHAAAGSILMALRLEKPLVVVARLQRLGECVDDHQIQLARALARRQRAIAVDDLGAAQLADAVNQAAQLVLVDPGTGSGPLVMGLRQQLAEWESGRGMLSRERAS
jgi:beta-1,4-N-acetylglucosaminyltransferase